MDMTTKIRYDVSPVLDIGYTNGSTVKKRRKKKRTARVIF